MSDSSGTTKVVDLELDLLVYTSLSIEVPVEVTEIELEEIAGDAIRQGFFGTVSGVEVGEMECQEWPEPDSGRTKARAVRETNRWRIERAEFE